MHIFWPMLVYHDTGSAIYPHSPCGEHMVDMLWTRRIEAHALHPVHSSYYQMLVTHHSRLYMPCSGLYA
jgi:hypothetical protein